MKAKFFGRKIVSILLALCLVIGMIPTFALAAEEEVEGRQGDGSFVLTVS